MSSKTEQRSSQYFRDLEARISQSQSVGVFANQKMSVELFYDRMSQKFTLLKTNLATNATTLFDAVQRTQWDREVLVFGHVVRGDGYMAQGHGSLVGTRFEIKLKDMPPCFFKADPNLPFLRPLFVSFKKQDRQRNPTLGTPHTRPIQFVSNEAVDDECDLTEDDLRRLRGDIPMEQQRPRPRF